ncbi:Gfo/Idh/MocA family oxidoreductase [Candidatus Poribacteria bacterium]|nr:Gfo/Idh/MocA family oxidoreductase [Candidatus Poribacteria bacterium]
MEGDKLRVGLVGCGGLGRREAQIAAQLEELVAVADVNFESAKALADELKVKPYDDHRKMLEENELDCVLVVTPTYTHAQITIDAASSGAHVFCEKPMAITLEECDRMLEAAAQNGVKLMIGFVRRFQPNYREMRRRAVEGEIGGIKLVQSVRMGGRPPVGIGKWRLERVKVGGLHSAYIHELDQMLWIAGDVGSVKAVVNYGTFPDTDVEDSIWICMEFKNGAIGALGSSQIYPVGWYELGVGGTKGAMKITGGTTSFQIRMHDGTSQTVTLPNNDAFVEELGHFFDCVRNDKEPIATGIDGRKSLQVVWAAFESAETGKTVYLD